MVMLGAGWCTSACSSSCPSTSVCMKRETRVVNETCDKHTHLNAVADAQLHGLRCNADLKVATYYGSSSSSSSVAMLTSGLIKNLHTVAKGDVNSP